MGDPLTYLNNIQGNLNDTNMVELNNIIQNENQRLIQKQTTVDNALQGQQRLLSLTDSTRLRYDAYNRIVIVITITLVIVIVWMLLSKVFPVVPSFIFDILTFVTILGGVFIGYFMYSDIKKRDNIDFTKLNITPPVALTPDQIASNQKAAEKSGNLLGTINFAGCSGPACCPPGTTWDDGYSVCVVNCPTGQYYIKDSAGVWGCRLPSPLCPTEKPNWNPLTSACDVCPPNKPQWDPILKKCVASTQGFTSGNLTNISANSPFEFESYSRL